MLSAKPALILIKHSFVLINCNLKLEVFLAVHLNPGLPPNLAGLIGDVPNLEEKMWEKTN